MLAGADPRVLATAAGHPAILDAGAGELIVDPDPQAALDLATADRVTPGLADRAPQEVTTADGEPVTLLCNVASAAETRLGLSGGAAGVGLLRTEIPFTGASGWPSQPDHLAHLTPVLGLLAGRPAVVRLLDFSGDKIPPFLTDGESGLVALLGAPEALKDQLRAILLAGADTRLAVLVPMVKDLDFSEGVYGFGAGIFFIGYLVFEIPGALIVEHYGARRWMARILISWGHGRNDGVVGP